MSRQQQGRSSSAPIGVEDTEQGRATCASSGSHFFEVTVRSRPVPVARKRLPLSARSARVRSSASRVSGVPCRLLSRKSRSGVPRGRAPRDACEARALDRSLAGSGGLLRPLRMRDAPVPLLRGDLRRAGSSPAIAGTIYDCRVQLGSCSVGTRERYIQVFDWKMFPYLLPFIHVRAFHILEDIFSNKCPNCRAVQAGAHDERSLVFVSFVGRIFYGLTNGAMDVGRTRMDARLPTNDL